MAETHEKDRDQEQPKQRKHQVSGPGLKTVRQENKDSPTSGQKYGNPDKNTDDT